MSTKSLNLALALALLPALAGAAHAQGTPEQRSACTPEVFRLCNTDVPNVGDITECLVRKRAKLSPACRAAMAPALPAEPEVKEAASTAAPRATRKRRSASRKTVPVEASAEPVSARTR